MHHLSAVKYGMQSFLPAAQRVEFAEKVHKPPFWVNVINFEQNGLEVPQIPKSYDALIEVFKFIRKKLHFCTYSSISVKLLHRLV